MNPAHENEVRRSEGRKRFEAALLRYVELKSGYADNGPAWIGYVTPSKSGRTLYFNGRALRKFKGQDRDCDGVQELAAECRLRSGYSGLKSSRIPEPRGSPVPVNLNWFHYWASFWNAFPYRSCANACAASNFFRRAEFAGSTISRLPSVLTRSGVSGSILSSSRIGRSMINARLFPCLVSFLTTYIRCITKA